MDKKTSKELINFLNAKWQGRPCPMCNERKWSVQDKFFELREFRGGSLVLGGTPIIPIIPVTCENCGHIILINAIKTGFVKPRMERKK
jgi:hypothetical protein